MESSFFHTISYSVHIFPGLSHLAWRTNHVCLSVSVIQAISKSQPNTKCWENTELCSEIHPLTCEIHTKCIVYVYYVQYIAYNQMRNEWNCKKNHLSEQCELDSIRNNNFIEKMGKEKVWFKCFVIYFYILSTWLIHWRRMACFIKLKWMTKNLNIWRCRCAQLLSMSVHSKNSKKLKSQMEPPKHSFNWF